jgi:Phage tail protein (Tail_P2_I)
VAKEFESLQRGDIPGGGQWTDAEWLRGPNAQAFLVLLGAEKDAMVDELRAAVKARWPGIGPPDALGLQGQGFDIERFPGESDELYTARLQRAWETHKLGGTAAAVVESLHAYGIPDVRIVEDWEGEFAPGNWYSRFWVVLGPDFGALGIAPLTMPFELGAPTLGSTASVDQVRAIKRQVLKWKDTHGYPVRIILRFGNAPVLGMALSMPFALGAAPGSGTASWSLGSGNLLGGMTMPFTLGGGYDI